MLQRVLKPARYTGGEYGTALEKRVEETSARILLCYPDTYELGMSNQGLKILYDRVNRVDSFLADRVFLPWPDMGDAMLESGMPLFSLDRHLAVSSFDVWGFNVSHELHYTNLLYALDLAGVPLLRKDRGPSDPLIIAGGSAASNPLPIFDFMDAIFLGDGEEGIIEIMERVNEGKATGKTRAEIIASLGDIEGIVLPETFVQEISEESGAVSYKGEQTKKRLYISHSFSELSYIPVPNISISQDRVVVEVARGCGQGCRFCHAGFWKRPVRNSTTEGIIEAAGRMLKKTGHNSVSLHALSLADYPWIEETVLGMAERFGPDGVSISLPSLRIQKKTIPLLKMTQGIRRSSVTFALEAGSENMRRRIRKKASEKSLADLMREIYGLGWDLVKVYYMLGLPDSEETEVEEIIRSLNLLGDIAHECGPRKNVNVTVSLFVPKPFTTFQWEAQRDPEYFFQGISRIKSGLKSRRVHIKYPDPWMAYVEGIFSRSDSRMGAYVLEAYRRGAKFDSWDDRFRRDIWQEIIREIPPRVLDTWIGKHTPDAPPPWNSVVNGYPIDRLLYDYKKFAEEPEKSSVKEDESDFQNVSRFPEELLKPVSIDEKRFETVSFLEVNFRKEGNFIYAGHLDTVETMRKAARRSTLPMTFSRGFNKHEKLHFTEPLPLFIASHFERIYFELYESIDPEPYLKSMAEHLPKGLAVNYLKLHERLPSRNIDEFTYRLIFLNEADALRAADMLQNAPETIPVRVRSKKKGNKRGKSAPVFSDKILKEAVSEIVLSGSTVQFNLKLEGGKIVSISALVTEYLGYPVERWNTDLEIVRLSSR